MTSQKDQKEQKQEGMFGRGCILFLLTCSIVFYLCFGFFVYHAMFSLSDNFYIEGYMKSRNNTIFGLETFINCSDWTHSVKEKPFLQELIRHSNSIKDSINITDIKFKSRATSDIPYELEMNGRLYQLPKKSKKLILLVHGFRMRQNHYTIIIPIQMLLKAFPDGEYDFMTMEYRNHGFSQKEYPSNLLPDKSYSTYGSIEYADVLGAITYARNLGYEEIGLYGPSMGGATIMNAYLRSNSQDNIRALFLDSPACDIEFTLQSNLYRVLGYALGHSDKLYVESKRMKIGQYLLWPAVKLMGTILKGNHPHGPYPPFLNDAYHLWVKEAKSPRSSDKSVALHFDHPESDILVPKENSERCSALASSISNLKVTSYYGTVNSKAVKRTFSECKDHCILPLSEPEQYYERLVKFFKENL